MVNLVERMLDLHKRFPKVKTPHERESSVLCSAQSLRTIAATDRQIDVLMCELHG